MTQVLMCLHQNTNQSPNSVYQYCNDCGAVRDVNRATGVWSQWHSCSICLLKAMHELVVAEA